MIKIIYISLMFSYKTVVYVRFIQSFQPPARWVSCFIAKDYRGEVEAERWLRGRIGWQRKEGGTIRIWVHSFFWNHTLYSIPNTILLFQILQTQLQRVYKSSLFSFFESFPEARVLEVGLLGQRDEERVGGSCCALPNALQRGRFHRFSFTSSSNACASLCLLQVCYNEKSSELIYNV